MPFSITEIFFLKGRNSMLHKVKSWPQQFKAVKDKGKRFEVRVNDRNYQVNDLLELREWDPKTKKYTGEKILYRITHKLQGKFGLPKDLAVLQLDIPWK